MSHVQGKALSELVVSFYIVAPDEFPEVLDFIREMDTMSVTGPSAAS